MRLTVHCRTYSGSAIFTAPPPLELQPGERVVREWSRDGFTEKDGKTEMTGEAVSFVLTQTTATDKLSDELATRASAALATLDHVAGEAVLLLCEGASRLVGAILRRMERNDA